MEPNETTKQIIHAGFMWANWTDEEKKAFYVVCNCIDQVQFLKNEIRQEMDYKQMVKETLSFHGVPEETILLIFEIVEAVKWNAYGDGQQKGMNTAMKVVEELREKYKYV